MNLFDTHCHLDLPAFDQDRTDVLSFARNAGVRHLLVPATERKGWQSLLDFCVRDTCLYPALGLHPVLLKEHQDDDIDILETLVQQQRPVAIGEIGLDYWIKELDKSKQQTIFEEQLKLAEKYRLPVVLHVRKAHDEVLKTLKNHDLPGGICHAFNGNLQQAEKYIHLNFKLGFGGMLTYPNANKLHRLATELPIESLVLETDAPDMTGAAHQYQRNSPAYLPEVLEILAKLRCRDPAEIAQQTTDNALQIINLGKVGATQPS